MVIRVVQLGSARAVNEGTRLGTVRHPPRGVRRSAYASKNWYDVWVPLLAPGADTVKLAQAAKTPEQWARFVRQYRREMAGREAARMLDLLAALSRSGNFSVGCYCKDESHCHRSVLRELLRERGAAIK